MKTGTGCCCQTTMITNSKCFALTARAAIIAANPAATKMRWWNLEEVKVNHHRCNHNLNHNHNLKLNHNFNLNHRCNHNQAWTRLARKKKSSSRSERYSRLGAYSTIRAAFSQKSAQNALWMREKDKDNRRQSIDALDPSCDCE